MTEQRHIRLLPRAIFTRRRTSASSEERDCGGGGGGHEELRRSGRRGGGAGGELLAAEVDHRAGSRGGLRVLAGVLPAAEESKKKKPGKRVAVSTWHVQTKGHSATVKLIPSVHEFNVIVQELKEIEVSCT